MASQPERLDRAPEPDSPAARAEALSIEGTLLRGAAPVDPKALVVDSRRLIKIFVSYAHEDAEQKEELLRLLKVRLKTSRHYRLYESGTPLPANQSVSSRDIVIPSSSARFPLTVG